jgi:PIN domain nuclease of toxin-antitoxin system
MSSEKAEMGRVNAHFENVASEDDNEKAPVTAYTCDVRTNSHHKSPMDRRLILYHWQHSFTSWPTW